jgi:predicted DNA-binding transcriptional regulator AlpA
MDSNFDSVRVVSKREAAKLANVSERTWDRLEAKGDVPTKTRISRNRIGYRVSDLKIWLDARREAPSARDMVDNWKPIGEAARAVAARVRP